MVGPLDRGLAPTPAYPTPLDPAIPATRHCVAWILPEGSIFNDLGDSANFE
jgi:hypothetical protein